MKHVHDPLWFINLSWWKLLSGSSRGFFLVSNIIGRVWRWWSSRFMRPSFTAPIHNVSPKSIIKAFLICIQKQFKWKCAEKKRTRRQLETSNLFSLNKLIDFKLSQLNEISRRVQTIVRVAKTTSFYFFFGGMFNEVWFGRAYCTFLQMKKKQRTINLKTISLLVSLFKAVDKA